jgi:hypothetical protein
MRRDGGYDMRCGAVSVSQHLAVIIILYLRRQHHCAQGRNPGGGKRLYNITLSVQFCNGAHR